MAYTGPMRVLVTGGAGFIGSAIVDALVSNGHGVVVLDNLDPAAHGGQPGYLNPGARYIWRDIRDGEAWREALVGVDAVCHQAAKVGLGVNFADVEEYVAANDAGMAAGLRAMHGAGFAGRIVLASSMVVYGEGGYACAEHGLVRPGPRRVEDLDAGRFEPPCPRCGAQLASTLVGEDAPLDPRNVYAATKLHQEHLCFAYSRESGAPVIALRYHNVYGPRMPRDTPYAGVASIFRSALEGGQAPNVFEDGGQRRDFVHVRDVASANIAALMAPSTVSGAFNVASGVPHTIGEMANALADGFGAAAPRPQVVGGYRLGDVRHIVASPEKAAAELGFRASVSFEAGMTEFAHAELRNAVAT